MTSLLQQIEAGALDSRVALADVLRKCIALGGRSGSESLRDWAKQELEGYPDRDLLPEYRVLPAIIAVDGVTFHAIVNQQPISPSSLPEFTHESISEVAPIFWGIGQIESMIRDADAGTIKITLPGASDLVRYMNAQDDQHNGQSITALYWALSASALNGLLDRVRTTLVGLVAELRASGALNDHEIPTPAAVNEAVSVVIHGAERSPITVNTSSVTGSNNTSSAVSGPGNAASNYSQPNAADSALWNKLRKPGSLLVGAATVAAVLVAIAAWQDWNPFS